MVECKGDTLIGIICRNCKWGHDASLYWIGSDNTYSCMQCKTVLLDSNMSIEELFSGLGWEGDGNVRVISYEVEEVE